MSENVKIAVYVGVFLVVLVPFVFLSYFSSRPKTDAGDVRSRNLPLPFRLTWGWLSLFSESAGELIGSRMPARKARLAKALAAADIRMSSDYVFVAECLFGLAGGIAGVLFGLLVSVDSMAFAGFGVLLAAVGFATPSMTVYGAAQRRQEAIMRTLPFSIDLIGSAMRSGIDFTAAVRYYVQASDKTQPLVLEYGILLRQLDLGKTRVQALEAMAQRIQSSAFRSFADAVIHGLEIGASIVETMKVQAEEMRRVRFNAAERKAARATSAMIFPIAVFIMPAMFLIIGTPVILRVMRSGLGGIMQ